MACNTYTSFIIVCFVFLAVGTYLNHLHLIGTIKTLRTELLISTEKIKRHAQSCATTQKLQGIQQSGSSDAQYPSTLNGTKLMHLDKTGALQHTYRNRMRMQNRSWKQYLENSSKEYNRFNGLRRGRDQYGESIGQSHHGQLCAQLDQVLSETMGVCVDKPWVGFVSCAVEAPLGCADGPSPNHWVCEHCCTSCDSCTQMQNSFSTRRLTKNVPRKDSTEKKNMSYAASAFSNETCRAMNTSLLITSIINLANGLAGMSLELYALSNVSDLSVYSIVVDRMRDPNVIDFVFPASSVAKGSFLYLTAGTSGQFEHIYGTRPNFSDQAWIELSGMEYIFLYYSGCLVDVFGDVQKSFQENRKMSYKSPSVVFRKNGAIPINTFSRQQWVIGNDIGQLGAFSPDATTHRQLPTCHISCAIPMTVCRKHHTNENTREIQQYQKQHNSQSSHHAALGFCIEQMRTEPPLPMRRNGIEAGCVTPCVISSAQLETFVGPCSTDCETETIANCILFANYSQTGAIEVFHDDREGLLNFCKDLLNRGNFFSEEFTTAPCLPNCQWTSGMLGATCIKFRNDMPMGSVDCGDQSWTELQDRFRTNCYAPADESKPMLQGLDLVDGEVDGECLKTLCQSQGLDGHCNDGNESLTHAIWALGTQLNEICIVVNVFAGLCTSSQMDEEMQWLCDWMRLDEMSLQCDAGQSHSRVTPCGARFCESCQPGRFAMERGLRWECDPCPVGKSSLEADATLCDLCDAGKYADSVGSSACEPCGVKMTTMKKVNVDGTSTWVLRDGSANETGCGCSEGTRPDTTKERTCVDCGRGLDCRGMGIVLIQPGFMADAIVDGKLPSVFECHGNALRCTGGVPGETCATGRTGVSCSQCLSMMTPNRDGTCSECEGPDAVPLVATLILAIMVLSLIYYVLDMKDHAKQSPWLLLCGMTLGIMVSTVQQVTIVAMFAINWPEPLLSVLKIIRLLVVDIEFLRLNCVASAPPAVMFAIKVVVITSGVVVVIFIHALIVVFKYHGRFFERMPSLIAALGTLIMMVYISVTATVLEPWQCLNNPNELMTVSTYQSVICYRTNEHLTMMIVSVLVIMPPLAFLTHCILIVSRFTSKMRAGDTRFMRTYIFLFFRYRPEVYWFAPVHMLRSLFLSLAPIIPSAIGQILVVQFLTIAYLVIVVEMAPWRLRLANLLEAFFTGMMLMILSVACFMVQGVPTSEVAWLGAAFITLLFVSVLLMLLYAIWSHLSRKGKKPYQFFICHHKIGAGCFARLLCMRLRAAKRTAFIDSDDLKNLDKLFDYVGNQTEKLVVLCSKEVLTRPWCVGEIVTAKISNIQIARLIFPDFRDPDAAFIDGYDKIVPDLGVLAQQSIGIDAIRETLQWLLDQTRMEVPEPFTSQNVDGLVNDLCSRTLSFGSKPSVEDLMAFRDAASVVIVDYSNTEALACTYILMDLLRPHLAHKPDLIPQMLPQRRGLPTSTKLVIIVCTSGVLQQADILKAVWRAGNQGCMSVPVISDEGFRFPTKQQFMEETSAAVACITGETSPVELSALFQIIDEIFKTIAIVFQPQQYGSTEQTLNIKAQELADRMLRTGGLTYLKSPTIALVLKASTEENAPEENSCAMDSADRLEEDWDFDI